MEKVSTIFQKHLLDLINELHNKTVKIKLEQNIERRMKRLFTSYENILKGIYNIDSDDELIILKFIMDDGVTLKYDIYNLKFNDRICY